MQLIRLSREYVPRVSKSLADIFIRNEPVCSAARLNNVDIESSFATLIRRCVESGMSFGYVDENDNIVASVVSIPYDELPSAMVDEETEKMKPITSLLDRLGDKYKPEVPMRATYAFMLGIDDLYVGRHLGTNLIRKTIEDSMKKNMREIIADCTGDVSQHIFCKHGGIIVAKELYSEFEYSNAKPFETVTSCTGAKRIVIKINDGDIAVR
jgi:hypothetical protein